MLLLIQPRPAASAYPQSVVLPFPPALHVPGSLPSFSRPVTAKPSALPACSEENIALLKNHLPSDRQLPPSALYAALVRCSCGTGCGIDCPPRGRCPRRCQTGRQVSSAALASRPLDQRRGADGEVPPAPVCTAAFLGTAATSLCHAQQRWRTAESGGPQALPCRKELLVDPGQPWATRILLEPPRTRRTPR